MKHLVCIIAAVALALPAVAHAEPRRVEISVRTDSAVLAGTLTLPEQAPRAALVMIQGAGPHTRDQVISGAPMFAEIADALAEIGVATLRIDNAGVGASTGERAQHFKQREPHIIAALDALAARTELRGAPIGLFGHSEGALVAAEVWAARADKIDFLILVGAPGRDGRTVWVDQQSNPERFPGADAEKLAAIRAGFDAVAVASIAADRDAVEAATAELFATIGLSAEEIAEMTPGFVARMASPEMEIWLGHDPAASFHNVTDPVLAIWGGIDPLTSPALNAPPLIEARNPHSHLSAVIVPHEEHFFLRGEGLEPGQHRRGAMRLSATLAQTIDAWLGTRD